MPTKKNVSISVCIIIVSLLLSLLWTGFDPEGYLIDDSRNQWFPVYERAFSDFFATGTLPGYDFFQFKGLDVAAPGYYSIMNPLMLLSFMASHFTPLPLSTITFYISLLFALGNLCFFWLCRNLHNTAPTAALLTGAYSSLSAFCSFGSSWYYVWGNYLIIPLLLLIFRRTEGKYTAWFSCGIVLALDLLLGNVQYTFYHYILFGLLCLVLIPSHPKRYIGIFCTNVITAVILSAPFLLMMLRTAGGEVNYEFFDHRMTLPDLFPGMLVPTGILNRWFGITDIPLFSDLMNNTNHYWLYAGPLAAIWLFLIVYGVYRLLSKGSLLWDKTVWKDVPASVPFRLIWAKWKAFCRPAFLREDGLHLLIPGLALGAVFFLSYLQSGLSAHLLHLMPVVKSFRYLFKTLFVFEPLLAVLTAAILPLLQQKLRKPLTVICCLFTVIGLVNNYCVAINCKEELQTARTMTIAEEKAYMHSHIAAFELETDSYRYLTLMQKKFSYSINYFHPQNGIIRNYATAAGIYSPIGYDISGPPEHLEQIDSLVERNIGGSYFRLMGCGCVDDFTGFIKNRPEKTEAQLSANAIRYLFVEKDRGLLEYYKDAAHPGFPWDPYDPAEEEALAGRDFVGEVLDALEQLDGITVERVIDWDSYFDVIVLSGTNGLCTDGTSVIPLSAERMDLLQFPATGASEYKLAFSYEEHLAASLTDAQGHTMPLTITPSEDGNTILHAPAVTDGTVSLTYRDPLCSLGFALELVISVLFCMMLLLIGRDREETAPLCH